MTTKKKKKTAMNAIDKYLMQKRYSQGKKDEENEKPTKKVIQVVLPKVHKSSELFQANVETNERSRRSARSAQSKVPEQKYNSSKKSVKKEIPKLLESTVQKQLRTRKSVAIPISNNKKKTKRHVRSNQEQIYQNKDKNENKVKFSRTISANQKKLVKKSKPAVRTANTSSDKQSNSENLVNNLPDFPLENSRKLRKAIRTAKSNETEETNDLSKKEKKSIDMPKNAANSQQERQVTSAISSVIDTATLITENNVKNDVRKKHSEDATCSLPKKKRKIVLIETKCDEEDTMDSQNQPSCSYVDVPSNCKDGNSDVEVIEEITPITKKYQPYMERLKSLTSDAIKKFIKDNQQYYVDYKKEIEAKTLNIPLIGKKIKRYDEMRDSFKCNPFNSDQQLAMYYTLREIFNVPRSHFKECRNFFTILIPEISCQLFAETFRIKVSFAPRLIKKLYPNPVCPV